MSPLLACVMLVSTSCSVRCCLGSPLCPPGFLLCDITQLWDQASVTASFIPRAAPKQQQVSH